MKAILENISSSNGNSSFRAYRYQVPFFEFKWHYHPEWELTYIVQGNGYRIVGNSYESFSAGDLVLLGSNLPHTWTGKTDNDTESDAVVIQFSMDFMLPFLKLQEGIAIKNMLERAARGLVFPPENELVTAILELPHLQGMEKVMRFIAVLDKLTQLPAKYIAPNTFHNVVSKKNELRINKVCTFLQDNFHQKITLQAVAELIHVTESNFCKFFKKATGKTLSDYVNELRINEASRLLLQSDATINQISYSCGFETLSYFNRIFLIKKGMTPKKFREINIPAMMKKSTSQI